MEPFLLQRIFEDTTKTLTLEQAKEKALLFHRLGKEIGMEFHNDYWIQISQEWDLNIWGDNDECLTLYQCEMGPEGYFVTDTQDGYVSIAGEPEPDQMDY